jgi:hypothetical protein
MRWRQDVGAWRGFDGGAVESTTFECRLTWRRMRVFNDLRSELIAESDDSRCDALGVIARTARRPPQQLQLLPPLLTPGFQSRHGNTM